MSKSNDVYAWGSHYNIDRVYGANGLNQLKASTPGSGQVSVPVLDYDARGNTTGIGTSAYTYSSENLLKTGPAGLTLAYDPVGRLYQTVGVGVTTRFQYDGADMIAEYNVSNALQRRYVHGPGVDEPILAYEGTGLAAKRYLTADERGSIVAITDSAGVSIAINRYDEYGNPASTNASIANGGRFGYTGQTWLPELNMWYYKARIYNPALGRFMQTDPIGYGDGMNLYNYVGSDPVNMVDPSGLEGEGEIVVTGPGVIRCGECTQLQLVAAINDGLLQGNDYLIQVTGPRMGKKKKAQTAFCPSRGVSGHVGDALGKLNTAGATVVGLLAGTASYVAGKIAGTNPSLGVGNNAIQFTGSPLNVGGRAFTLGNVQVYGKLGPATNVRSYSGHVVNLGRHEEAHTYQAQALGSVGYVAAHLALGLGKDSNPLEQAADRYARRQSCSGF